MEGFKEFLSKYIGAIIGIILIVFKVKKSNEYMPFGPFIVMAAIVLIILGAFVGNYVQKNKDEVKEKLKKFIDRL